MGLCAYACVFLLVVLYITCFCDILFDMLVHSFIVKQTSYHKNIQASEQRNGANVLIFKYHAYCTALSVIHVSCVEIYRYCGRNGKKSQVSRRIRRFERNHLKTSEEQVIRPGIQLRVL